MRALTTPELLQVWELGLQRSRVDRALTLLYIACSKDDGDPATLSIGQCDARLLQLREWMFGSKLLNTANCPACRQKVEWENNVKDFMLQSIVQSAPTKRFELSVDG